MKEVYELTTLREIEDFLKVHELSFIYISRPDCSICHALLPKLKDLLSHYPRIRFGHIERRSICSIIFVEGKAGPSLSDLLLNRNKAFFEPFKDGGFIGKNDDYPDKFRLVAAVHHKSDSIVLVIRVLYCPFLQETWGITFPKVNFS